LKSAWSRTLDRLSRARSSIHPAESECPHESEEPSTQAVPVPTCEPEAPPSAPPSSGAIDKESLQPISADVSTLRVGTPGDSSADGDASLSRLTQLARSFGLLLLEAWSLRLAAAFGGGDDATAIYVLFNHIDRAYRASLVAGVIQSASAAGIIALALPLLPRFTQHRVYQLARRLCPLALAAPVALLFDWRLWVQHEIAFSILTLLSALGLMQSVRVARDAPPLLGRWRLGPRLRSASDRIHERVPRLMRSLPLAVVMFCAAGYTAYFGYYTVNYHLNGYTSAWDLGLLENLVYNTWHGAQLFKSSPFDGPDGSHFVRHATFFAFVIAPVYALSPRAETLLWLQALLVGAAAVPLFLFARRYLREWTACIIALAYLLHPGVHGANLYDFHFLTISPLFIFGILWAFESRRDVVAWILVALALSIREDVALGVAVLGTYLLLSGRRPWPGFTVALLGLGYFLVMKLFIMPDEGDRPSFIHAYQGLALAGEQSFSGIIKTVVTNPAYVLRSFLTEIKLRFVLQLLVPVMLLPLRRWVGLLLLLPGIAFSLLTTPGAPTAVATVQLPFQYTAHWTPYLFAGTVLALADLARAGGGAVVVVGGRAAAATLGLVFATLACSYQFGAVLQHNTAHSGFDLFRFVTKPVELEQRGLRDHILAQIPPDAAVAASSRLLPHLANRENAYTLFTGIHDAEYVAVDFGLSTTRLDDRARTLELLRTREFGVVDIAPPFALLQRGHSTERNDELIGLIVRSPTLPPPP